MPMNKLPAEKRAQALQMMAEGVSLRAITRLTGIRRRKWCTSITIEALNEDAMTGAIFTYRDLMARVYCEEPLAKN